MTAPDPFAAPLASAPQSRSIALVIGTGLATTVATLAGVRALELDGVVVMGWYADYVLPVGALLVGVSATSGYAVGSWFGGRKISGALLGVVVALSLLAYVAAQYVDYRVALSAEGLSPASVGFLAWYDFVTRSFQWEEHGSGGDPLGGWGYLLRLGEISGFALGGLVAPAVLRNRPYCEECLQYNRSRTVCTLPAGTWPKKLWQGKQAWTSLQVEGQERGEHRLREVLRAAAAGDWAGWSDALAGAAAEPGGKKPGRLHARIQVQLWFCRECSKGMLIPSLVVGHGRSTSVQKLPAARIPRDSVRQLRG